LRKFTVISTNIIQGYLEHRDNIPRANIRKHEKISRKSVGFDYNGNVRVLNESDGALDEDSLISMAVVEANLTQTLTKLSDAVYDARNILDKINPIMQDKARVLIAQRLAQLYYDAHFASMPRPEDLKTQAEIYYESLGRFQIFVAVKDGKLVGFVSFYFVNSRGEWKIEDLVVGKDWQKNGIGSALLDSAVENGILQMAIDQGRVLRFYLDPSAGSYTFYQGGTDSETGDKFEGYFAKRSVNAVERRPGWWLEANEAPDRLIHAQIFESGSGGNTIVQPNSGASQERPSASAVSDKGGIDFRALPITTQPAIAGQTRFVRAQMPLVGRTNNDQDWRAIENMLEGGIIPSAERVKDYLLARCDKGNIDEEMGRVLSCIADILRLEEENASSSDSSLRKFLVLLESDKPLKEFKTALNSIHFAAKEPSLN